MKQPVYVGLSGGVDSSVAAYLLKEAGYQVHGVLLDLWRESASCDDDPNCPARAAARVAAELGIEFEILDWRERFRRQIVDEFTAAYARGLTPNPCVNCNPRIKFAALLELAAENGGLAATGHYLRRRRGPRGWELHRGEPAKDQSYFLWRLRRADLERLTFPLGEMRKTEVRRLAAGLGLSSAGRSESQDVCFMGGGLRSFLGERLASAPGPLIDLESGAVIGEHAGAAFYTVGQRKGLGLFKSHLERYVVEVRPRSNEVVVGPRRAVEHGGLEASGLNLLADAGELGGELAAVIRYRARPVAARVAELNVEAGRLRLLFAEPQFAVAPGQSVVLYKADRLLGGAVIERALPAPS